MASAPPHVFVGLDVGSHTSCVATSHEGIVDVKLNSQGKRETPSSVAYGNRRVVGGLGSPGHNATVISEVKCIMGKRFDDPSVKKLAKAGHLGDVIEGVGGRCGFRVPSADAQLDVVAEQIMATLLKQLTSIAQSESSGTVRGAVLAVPVFFGEAERSAMLTAAELAGLSDVHVMNDLTAAALDWTALHAEEIAKKSEPIRVAFVDVGHSSTQVCIADVTNTEVRVVAHAWDSTLGGRYLDEVLTADFAQKFYAKHRQNITTDSKAYSRMIKAVQKMRVTLTTVEEAHTEVEDLMGDIDFSMDLTRKQFGQTTAEALKRIGGLCQKALTQAQEHFIPIHCVEMVGATSRTPVIEKLVGQAFGQSVKRTMNSKECVSRGCAARAAMESQLTSPSKLRVIDQCSSDIICDILDKDKNRETVSIFSPRHQNPDLRMLPQACTIPVSSHPIILRFYSATHGSEARQEIAEVYVADTVKAPEDAKEKQVSVVVRLDRNGLLRVMTASMQYAQLSAPVTCIDPFDDYHHAMHRRLSVKGVDGSRRKAWDSSSEQTEYPTYTIVRSVVHVAHQAVYSSDASKGDIEAWQGAEQKMLADDEDQRLTDQARNEFEKLNISMRKKLDREWACCSHLQDYQCVKDKIDMVGRHLRGGASRFPKEEFIKGYTTWQMHEQNMEKMALVEKQRIGIALSEFQDWCNAIDANRSGLFGMFANSRKRRELLKLCASAKTWLVQARDSWSTTVVQVHNKMAEFHQEKARIEDQNNAPLISSSSAPPQVTLRASMYPESYPQVQHDFLAHGAAAQSPVHMHEARSDTAEAPPRSYAWVTKECVNSTTQPGPCDHASRIKSGPVQSSSCDYSHRCTRSMTQTTRNP